MDSYTTKVFVRIGWNGDGEPVATACTPDDGVSLDDGTVDETAPHHDYVLEVTGPMPPLPVYPVEERETPDAVVTLPEPAAAPAGAIAVTASAAAP